MADEAASAAAAEAAAFALMAEANAIVGQVSGESCSVDSDALEVDRPDRFSGEL